jgi:hypothetical protein
VVYEFRCSHDREGGIRERVSDSCGAKTAAVYGNARKRNRTGALEGWSYARQQV